MEINYDDIYNKPKEEVKPPKFCYRCGTKLVYIEKIKEYDTETGHPKYHIYPRCKVCNKNGEATHTHESYPWRPEYMVLLDVRKK